MNRIIAHLDMDAFFAAIEERDNPRFRGFPIVIGADPKGGLGRGVVSTANYEARKYGIHSAMPISTAWRLSQNGVRKGGRETVFLPVHMERYAKVSQKIFEIVRKYSPIVEEVSIDEAYLDLSFLTDYSKAHMQMKTLKQDIYENEHLRATVGIGPNKLVAKLASSTFKPDGLTVVYCEKAEQFLESVDLTDIPGIGPKTREFLQKKHIKTVFDLKKKEERELVEWFGKWGRDMYLKVRGIDESRVEVERQIKSISEQETFEQDVRSPAVLLQRMEEMAKRVIERVGKEQIRGFKTVTIMIRFDDFETKTRSHSCADFTLSEKLLQTESLKLLLPFLDRRENPKQKAFRLVGVGVSHFKGDEERVEKKEVTYSQIDLFKR